MATTVKPRSSVNPSTSSAAVDELTAPPADAKTPGGRRRVVFILLGVALLALIGEGARKYIWSRSHVSTDNAQVDGHIVPILPKVGGFVLEVRVDENQDVKGGDVLVVLDDRDSRAGRQRAEPDLGVALANVSSPRRVGQADAAVRQAQANADKAHQDLDRIRQLASQDIASKQQLDGAEAAVQSADAAL